MLIAETSAEGVRTAGLGWFAAAPGGASALAVCSMLTTTGPSCSL